MVDGSMIFVRNTFLLRPIERVTGSNIVHCAICLFVDGEPYGYEATWPLVRRLPWAKFTAYWDERCVEYAKRGGYWSIATPKLEFSQWQLRDMKNYANAQLGKHYRLKSYWKDRDVGGFHCSQYTGNIMARAGLIKSDDYKETPVSLYKKLEPFFTETRQ
jgi:hypothetical protein